MLRFDFHNIEELKQMHYDAVEDYIKSLSSEKQDEVYGNIILLKGFEQCPKVRSKVDYSWLWNFILADLRILRNWVATQPGKLRFKEFQELYGTKFSNGMTNFVDKSKTYNAYVLIEKMNINVCPYCDEEYLDVVDSGGKVKRTSEFDHFFPESSQKYPALAMCFYNLVLSGQNCNGLKHQKELGASPYDEDIEELTFLYPDLEIGVNMESVEPEECKVLLHAKGGMTKNETTLGLSDRYANRYEEAYRLLRSRQMNCDESLQKMVEAGYYKSKEEALDVLFGPAYKKGKFRKIHQKMKHDLVGY